jgi:hypothetical protein
MAFAGTAPSNPYGTYFVQPTDHGLRFQVSVRDPRNTLILTILVGKSIVVALLASAGWWRFLLMLGQLFILDALFYSCVARTRLTWIEVRPDGLVITPKINQEASSQFFDRRAITSRALDFDQGLTLRYGIHDIRATPGFADEREFEIFELQLEQAIARLWHQENLDR